MKDRDLPSSPGTPAATGRQLSPTVVRSAVKPGLPYKEYKRQLRYDFFYSCAYCTITEAEASAVRLLIDHYEPVSARPELMDSYENLMYACEPCNLLKGDRCPTPEARERGRRFFRLDQEPRSQHFELKGDELVGLTEVGKFNILCCDLNRASLRRLRCLRRNLTEYEGYAGEGIMALAGFQIDRLHPSLRLQALGAIKEILETATEVFRTFDDLLIESAKSELLIDDLNEEDAERSKDRKARIKEIEGMFPGNWRGRANKGKRH